MTEVRMPDLFNIDSKGKLRIRQSRVYRRGQDAIWEVKTGIDGGNLITQEQVYHPGDGKQKRDHFEQALFEQASKHELKMRKEKYVADRNLAQHGSQTDYPPPMLADTWNPTKHQPPYYMQPKMDGNRCLAHVDQDGNVKMWSRSGNFFQGLGHVEKELVRIAGDVGPEGFTFDGELFTWEMPFKDLNGALKRESDKGDGPKKLIQFWWYDYISDEPWTVRAGRIQQMSKVAGLKVGGASTRINWAGPVVQVPTTWVGDQQAADSLHGNFVGQGFEGSIIRLLTGAYEADKRSKSLLKRKDFQDAEYIIDDIQEAEGAPGQGVFVCQLGPPAHHSTFRAALKGSHEERAELLKNKKKYIGKRVTVCFFEKYEDGTPRFPIALRVRDEV